MSQRLVVRWKSMMGRSLDIFLQRSPNGLRGTFGFIFQDERNIIYLIAFVGQGPRGVISGISVAFNLSANKTRFIAECYNKLVHLHYLRLF